MVSFVTWWNQTVADPIQRFLVGLARTRTHLTFWLIGDHIYNCLSFGLWILLFFSLPYQWALFVALVSCWGVWGSAVKTAVLAYKIREKASS